MMPMHKALFMVTLIMGSLISISASTWLGIWMGLEINLLSIIPLMTSPTNPLSNESAIKYFITQALASAMLMFAVLSSEITSELASTIMIESVMFAKMGAAPFHFWFPEVMEGLSWLNALLLLTWQKLAPMIVLTYTPLITSFTMIVIIASMAISGVMGINQTSVRKIMAFSSMNHIGWMLSTILFIETIWTVYFSIYTLISISIVSVLAKLNISHFNQLMNAIQSPENKIMFSLNFFSLGGMPPFLGFLPKWLAIQGLIEIQLYLTTLLMIMLTMIPLYFYIRMTIASLTLTKETPLIPSTLTNFSLESIFNSLSILGLVMSTILFNFL